MTKTELHQVLHLVLELVVFSTTYCGIILSLFYPKCYKKLLQTTLASISATHFEIPSPKSLRSSQPQHPHLPSYPGTVYLPSTFLGGFGWHSHSKQVDSSRQFCLPLLQLGSLVGSAPGGRSRHAAGQWTAAPSAAAAGGRGGSGRRSGRSGGGSGVEEGFEHVQGVWLITSFFFFAGMQELTAFFGRLIQERSGLERARETAGRCVKFGLMFGDEFLSASTTFGLC